MVGRLMELETSKIGRIIECHYGIIGSMKQTIDYAIEAGELLTEKKEELKHGDFLPWIKNNIPFSEWTVRNYIKVYIYRNKMGTLPDLQTAYRQIETIEKQQKQNEHQKVRLRVSQFQETGIKPDGWRRGTDDKLVQEDLEVKQRIQKAKDTAWQIEQNRKINNSNFQDRKQAIEDDINNSSFLDEAAGIFSEQYNKKKTFKEKIKLSQSGESDLFIDALMDYLEELEDDNRRVEACNNIIKVCRNISAELQRV